MSLGEAFMLYGVDYDGLVSFDPKFHTYQRKQLWEMSGGEARIAEIYLVLNSEAEFCILDEPFSNIAPKHVEKMQELIIQHLKIRLLHLLAHILLLLLKLLIFLLYLLDIVFCLCFFHRLFFRLIFLLI